MKIQKNQHLILDWNRLAMKRRKKYFYAFHTKVYHLYRFTSVEDRNDAWADKFEFSKVPRHKVFLLLLKKREKKWEKKYLEREHLDPFGPNGWHCEYMRIKYPWELK